MENCESPRRRGRPVWRPLSYIGLPVRADLAHRDRDGRISRAQMIDRSRFKKLSLDELTPTTDSIDRPAPLLESLTREDSPEVHSSEMSRFKLLPVDDLTSSVVDSTDRSDDDDDDCPFGDPFLEDGFGNLTKWRLTDLEKEFIKHLESESSKPKTKEKKLSKEEKLKLHNDRLEQYMKSALSKYNDEENLDGDSCFKFVKAKKESFIVEGDIMFYQHFNFAAMQTHTTISVFFAEVIPDGETCDVTCCKLLQDDDNGRCLGCKNQGDPDLRHPSCESVYAGGHEDCVCPFLLDTDSDEDDSD